MQSTTETAPVKITYQSPYGECAWRIQTFDTREEAERMVAFYQSCGSPAKIIG